MAIAAPLIGGLAGYGAAAAIGLGAMGTAIATVGGAALGASMMSKSKKSAAPAPAPTPEPTPTPPPAPTPPAPPPPPPSVDTAPGGAVRQVEEVAKKGRQSTILTSGRGIIGEESTRPERTLGASDLAGGLLRPGRGMGGGLIA